MSDKIWADLTQEWSEILADVASERTLYVEGSGVYVYISDTLVEDYTTILDKDVRYIGGILSTIDIPERAFVYAKSHQPIGKVFHLPKGMRDPDQDMRTVNDRVSTVLAQLLAHIDATGNVHGVTREQLDLDNIPNSISDNPTLNSSEVLLTTKGSTTLFTIINSHKENQNNPHGITKAQLGLDKVSNLRIPLTESEVMDIERNDLYATIKNVHDIVFTREQQLVNIIPNTVVEVQSFPLSESDYGVCDPTAKTVVLDDNQVVCPSGLQVSYSIGNRYYISQITTSSMSIMKESISPSVDPVSGYHYIYADIDTNKNISGIGHTIHKPYYGKYPIPTEGDYFNTLTNRMYNSQGVEICRVYIGKIYVEEDNTFSSCIPVPKGCSYTHKTNLSIVPNQTYILDNPFFECVDVIPKIYINGQWCDPKWNDQVGVIATYDFQRPNNVIVQTGSMGLAMPAVSSGNAFTVESLPTTTTAAAPLMLEIYKRRM
jgi:hypothetical protein